MTIAIGVVRAARLQSLRTIPYKFQPCRPPFIMNSSTAAFQTSHADGDNAIPPKQMATLQNLKLNDGNEIPMLGYGLGTARYKSNPNAPEDRELIKTVVMAIKAGYYHLDGAQAYGNEKELGIAIKESGVPREKLYVTTKIRGTIPLNTNEAFQQSLDNLGLDYVDQYLIHAPYFAKSGEDLQKKWAEFEEIHASGKAKSIGVSNFLKPQLEAILKTAKVIPAINQIEYHPYLQHADLIEFHKANGIATSAYGPLTPIVRAKPGPLDETYEHLARKYGVTPGEVALRWIIDQGVVALTTSGSEDRLKGYQKVAQFKLTPKEVEEIAEIGKQKHFRGFWKDKFAADDRS